LGSEPVGEVADGVSSVVEGGSERVVVGVSTALTATMMSVMWGWIDGVEGFARSGAVAVGVQGGRCCVFAPVLEGGSRSRGAA
jgi:hypothetical protein